MKQKLKNIIESKEIWIFTAITLIFFGMLMKMEFAIDTYATLGFSKSGWVNQFGPCGRFVLIVFGIIVKSLKLTNETIYSVSFVLAIICMIISLIKLYYIIKDEVKQNSLKTIIPILIVLNIFSLELFLFVEKGIMIFAILMNIYAVASINKWFKENNFKYIIFASIFMLIANFSYQGTVGLFVVISLVFIIKYSKNIKEFIKNNIVVALVYAVPALIDYLLVKILYANSRVNGQINIMQSLQKVLDGTKYMINSTYEILPKYFFLVCCLIVIGILIYKIITKKIETKYKIIEILKVCYIIIGTIFATIAPQLMQSTNSIWFVARSSYPYAAIYGILILYLCMNFDISKYVEKFIIILSVILLAMQYYKFNIIETDRYKTNELDYEITRQILEAKEKYEERSGEKVTKIAIYEDKSMGYSYYGIFAIGDTNLKAYSKDWSIISIINYYSGIKLEQVEKDEKIQEEFKEYDWTSFKDEQIRFIGDTLHFCIY